MKSLLRSGALAATLLIAASSALAQAANDHAALRKALAERLPNMPKIDEIIKTPIPGLLELRIGTDIFYADEKGDYIVQGSLIETRTKNNLTEARIDKLTAVDFAQLPLKDALVYTQGNGQRKLAVFADPNCGYCKRFERDLTKLKDVTIYTFVYPILGDDSTAKSRDIWCAKDAAKTWRGWMIDGQSPTKMMGKCDTAAIERNVEFGRKYRVNGTPAVFFEDGTRKPGAMPLAELERLLAQARKG